MARGSPTDPPSVISINLKIFVSEGTSPPAHNYGYRVRSYKDFAGFDIGALRTDRCVPNII